MKSQIRTPKPPASVYNPSTLGGDGTKPIHPQTMAGQVPTPEEDSDDERGLPVEHIPELEEHEEQKPSVIRTGGLGEIAMLTKKEYSGLVFAEFDNGVVIAVIPGDRKQLVFRSAFDFQEEFSSVSSIEDDDILDADTLLMVSTIVEPVGGA